MIETQTEEKKGAKARTSYSHRKSDARKERKQMEAINRQAKYDALTIAEKVTLALSRRGQSKRELARLKKPKEATKTVTTPASATAETKPVNKYKKGKIAKA